MKIPKTLLLTLSVSVSSALILVLLAFFYFRAIPKLFSILNFLAVFIVALPLAAWYYSKHKRKKEIEELFTVFLRDFVECVRGGLTIPEAFKSVSKNNYKSLTPYIKKIAAQLDWGIPLETVLLNFVKEVNSKFIGRIVSSVIETHRFGGRLAETFESLSRAALEIERLRTERKVLLQSQMITGYIIFFVFIGVIVGLEKFLVPSLAQVSTSVQVSPELIANQYKSLFRDLIFIQSFFAGLMVGKMAEGAIAAGIKHSLIMLLIGGLVFLFIG